MRQQSIFTYSLSRPFPSRSYNWIIIIGGIILTVLFSFVAVASNAYQLQSIYTTDPNATVSHKEWYQKEPFSWLADMDTTCQAALLTVGDSYLTTNRGFVYTLDRIRQDGQNATDKIVLSTAAYRNTTLSDCRVAEIVIELARRDNSRLPRNFWAWGATTARATTTCKVQSDVGIVSANFTATLPPVSDASQIIDNFLTQNTTGSVSMWYGIQTAYSWYRQLSTGMGYSTPDSDDTNGASWGAGTIQLTRNLAVNEYKDAKFFFSDVGISNDHGGLSFMHGDVTIEDWRNQWTTTDEDKQYKLPNISTTVDAFGKTFYSLLLSDFGVANETNALLTADGIEYLQSVNNTELAEAANGESPGLGTITHYFDPATDGNQNLTTIKAPTLFSQYLCSVPRRKGGFSLFFSVLIADIVILSACWTLFSFLASWWIGRKDPHSDYCLGCVAAMERADIALADRGGVVEGFEHAGSESGYLPVYGGSGGEGMSTKSLQPLVHQRTGSSN